MFHPVSSTFLMDMFFPFSPFLESKEKKRRTLSHSENYVDFVRVNHPFNYTVSTEKRQKFINNSYEYVERDL